VDNDSSIVRDGWKLRWDRNESATRRYSPEPHIHIARLSETLKLLRVGIPCEPARVNLSTKTRSRQSGFLAQDGLIRVGVNIRRLNRISSMRCCWADVDINLGIQQDFPCMLNGVLSLTSARQKQVFLSHRRET
jgi:hypothetical protein